MRRGLLAVAILFTPLVVPLDQAHSSVKLKEVSYVYKDIGVAPRTMLLTPENLYPIAVFASAVIAWQQQQAVAQWEANQPLSFGLFPCIETAESGNNPTDHSGLYGDLDSTWNWYDGYPYAGAAPVSVQNEFNLALYQRDGWRPWNDPCTGT